MVWRSMVVTSAEGTLFLDISCGGSRKVWARVVCGARHGGVGHMLCERWRGHPILGHELLAQRLISRGVGHSAPYMGRHAQDQWGGQLRAPQYPGLLDRQPQQHAALMLCPPAATLPRPPAALPGPSAAWHTRWPPARLAPARASCLASTSAPVQESGGLGRWAVA